VSGQRLEQQTNAAFNVSGSAPKYACRAWVNFDGTTTTPSIRASGNVSSVTRNGTGDYTVNFATAMADENYTITTAINSQNVADFRTDFQIRSAGMGADATLYSTAAVRLISGSTTTAANAKHCCVAVFR
jgi:hypothetical protein